MGSIPGTKYYKDFEENDFDTLTGKVEIYSSYLEKHGFDPLPKYYEPPESPFSEPDLVGEYPLVFTSAKSSVPSFRAGR
jgi:anaerobic selenocysteine-containing dehydrogenase